MRLHGRSRGLQLAKSQDGFTLLELLVVIIAVFILAAIVLWR